MDQTPDKIRRLMKIRKFLGGSLIFYVFILMAVWFFDLYLIAKHLTPLPSVLMIITLVIFFVLFLSLRSVRRALETS